MTCRSGAMVYLNITRQLKTKLWYMQRLVEEEAKATFITQGVACLLEHCVFHWHVFKPSVFQPARVRHNLLTMHSLAALSWHFWIPWWPVAILPRISSLKAEVMITLSAFIRMPCWTVISPLYCQYGRKENLRQCLSSHPPLQNSLRVVHISSSLWWSCTSYWLCHVMGRQSITCHTYSFNSSCFSSFVGL